MIENSRELPLRLFAALLLPLVAACSVSASGQIPCADDSSCPANYPVCKAHFCVEGTGGQTGTASVSVVGVPGVAATTPVSGVVTVQVVAKASSGVASLSLSATLAGGTAKTFSPAADATGPVYNISVDTKTLGGDGTVSLVATVTPGDTTQAAKNSDAFAIVVDNTSPTLSSAALTSADVKPGATVGVDVTANEALGSITGTVSLGSTSVTLVETSASGNVHHLAAGLPANAAAGSYAVSITATDKAGNSSSISAPSVSVHAPSDIPATALALATAANVTSGGVLLAKGSDTVNITVTLPAAFVLAAGGKPGIAVGPSGAAGAALTVSGTGPYTASFPITATASTAQPDGSYVVTVTGTDIGGNVSAAVTKPFVVDRGAPSVTGLTVANSFVGPNQGLSVTFTASEVPASVIATVTPAGTPKGLSCSALATAMTCTYSGANIGTDVSAGNVIASVPLSIVIKDAVGNSSAAATATVTFDNKQPGLTPALFGPASATDGTLITTDLTADEALSSLTVTVFNGSTPVGLMSDVSAPTGLTHHLGFAASGLTAGTYTVKATGTDLANNTRSSATVGSFTVYGAFSLNLGDLLLTGAATEDGLPAVSGQTGKKTLSGTLTMPIGGAQLGSNTVSFTLSGTASSSPTTQPTANTFTYDVAGGDTDGIATVTASLTDVAGNTSTTTASFKIDKTGPQILNGTPGITVSPATAGVNKPVTISFATDEVPHSITVTVNGNAASCNSGVTSVSCTYTPTLTDNGAASAPASFPISVTVTDILNNPTVNTAKTVIIDNQKPLLGTQTPLPSSGIAAGTQVTLCICPSETLTSLTGTAGTAGVLGTANEIPLTGACTTSCSASSPAGNGGAFPGRVLAFNVPSGTASGSYPFNATGTDVAGNAQTVSPTFSVNGSFQISSGVTVSQNPGTVGGLPGYMGPVNATQYACTPGTASVLGGITVAVTLPAGETAAASNPVYTFIDSGGHSNVLLGTPVITGSTTHTYTLTSCIPATASGYGSGPTHNATDGVATINVAVTDTNGNTAVAATGTSLSTSVYVKSAAPQVANASTTTAIVGPPAASKTLSFKYGVSEVPAGGFPTYALTMPSSCGATTDANTFSCSLSGQTYTCSHILSANDIACTSGTYAAPLGIGIAVTLQDGIGNQSVTNISTASASVPSLMSYAGSVTGLAASLTISSITPSLANTSAANWVLTSSEDLGGASTFLICSTTSPTACTGLTLANAVSTPCGATTPCTISSAGSQTNASAHTSVAYHLRVTPADAIGNLGAVTDVTGAGTTFTLDQRQPAFTGSFTTTVQENPAQTCTNASISACNGAVTASANQHLIFSGTTTSPPSGTPNALQSASLTSKCPSTTSNTCGIAACLVNGTSFTCTIAVSSAYTNSADSDTAAITLTDVLGNASGALATPTFLLDNTAPTLGTVTVTNTGTGLSSNPVVVHNAQQLKLVSTASKSLASAVIQTAPGASSGGCTISGSGASTQVTCLLTIDATGLTNSGCTTANCTAQTATIRVIDLFGNQIAADKSTPSFTIDNVPPTMGAFTVTNLATGLSTNPVSVKNGQQLKLVGTASETVASAVVQTAPGNTTGSCSISSGTTVTCLLNIDATGMANTGCTTSACTQQVATIRVFDAVGNQIASDASTPSGVNGFTIDNVVPTIPGAFTVTNLTTNLSSNPVFVKNGQQLKLVATASRALGSASVQSAPGATTGSCSVNSTTVTCLLNIDASGLANTGCTTATCTAQTATVRVFDTLGNQIASDKSTPNFTIDNVLPTWTAGTVTNLTTNATSNPVGVTGGQTIQFAGTVNKTIATLTIAASPTTIGTGSCNLTGTCTISVLSSATTTQSGAANVTLTDALGNTSTTGVPTFVVDNTMPAITNSAATPIYTRNGASSTVTYTIGSFTVAVNGTVTVKAYATLADALADTNVLGTPDTPGNTGVTSTISIASDTAGKNALFIRAFDSNLNSTSPVRTTVKKATLSPTKAWGARTTTATIAAGATTAPFTPSQLTEYDITSAVTSTFGKASVGIWETVQTGATTGFPSARTRPFVGFNPSTRKLIVHGGVTATGGAADVGGNVIADAKTNVLSLSAGTWDTTTVGPIPTSGSCDTNTTSNGFEGLVAYDPFRNSLIAHGGRCTNGTGNAISNVNLSGYVELTAAGTTWSAITGTSTDVGTPGAFVYDSFLGGLFNYGYSDGANAQANLAGIFSTLIAVPAYSNLATTSVTNAYGISSAVWPSLVGYSAVLYGGFASTANFNDPAGAPQSTTSRWNGSSFAANVAGPTARAYAGMAAETTYNQILMAGGITKECQKSRSFGNGSGSHVLVAGFGSTCDGTNTDFVDDVQVFNALGSAGAGQWTSVNLAPESILLGLTNAENGSSFHGFFDSTNNKFYVYRPAARVLNSFEVARGPRILVVVDGSAEGITSSTVSALTVNVTTSSPGILNQGSSVGTKVSLWNFNTSTWTEQATLEQASGISTGSSGTPGTASGVQSISSPTNFVQDGVLYLLVEPATIPSTLDNKSVSVGAVSVAWTEGT